MHVVDNSSRGADGVRLADFNRDGLMDVVTGWEEGGLIRVYQNPGHKLAKQKWPAVTVGKVKSPEDAVFVDLDSDGALDVVSSCEGRTKTMYVHWAPSKKDSFLDEDSWVTEPIPATKGKAAWMFALPADIDQKNGTDIFVGAKGGNACVGWLQSPKNPRNLKDWKFHRIEDAGWIMSLRKVDWNDKSHLLVSDRKGSRRGVYFLTPKVTDNVLTWKRTELTNQKQEYMFLDFVKSEGSPTGVVWCATRNGKSLGMRVDAKLSVLKRLEFTNPHDIPSGKAVAVGDIDLDGTPDMVFTANTQTFSKRTRIGGVHWFKGNNVFRLSLPIAGAKGKKYDRIELLDLDGDGDLDVLTCEEAANLGVIWFENPTR